MLRAQQTARLYANKYWTDLANSKQYASNLGDIREMYQKIKIATGKATQKTAPLKSKYGDIISDKPKQLERWMEHYYWSSTHSSVKSAVLNF